MTPSSPPRNQTPIGPDLRAALVAMVRKRVPESEVEDIVQATLTEAVVSPHAPRESDALRRWLFGVAKNKVVDFHRRRGRETFDLPEVAGSPAPHQEADLLRWAEKNLPPGEDAQKTLDWMLREGEGEKLESIAESEHVPAPRVRQRVSRLRRHLKDHWKREVATLAALGVLITVAIALWLREKDQPESIAHDPTILPPDPRAEELRKEGLELCGRSEWTRCIEKLDEAKRLDPAGDTRPEVKKARVDADKADETNQIAPPLPSAAPSAAPAPAPTFSDSSFRGPRTKDSTMAPTKPVAKSISSDWVPAPKATAMPPKTAPQPTFAPKGDTKLDTKGEIQQKNATPTKKKSGAPAKPSGWSGGSSSF